jgi:recombinational DNA repair protein RecR
MTKDLMKEICSYCFFYSQPINISGICTNPGSQHYNCIVWEDLSDQQCFEENEPKPDRKNPNVDITQK